MRLYIVDNKEIDRQSNIPKIQKIFSSIFNDVETIIVSEQEDEFELRKISKFLIVNKRNIMLFLHNYKYRRIRKLKYGQILADSIKEFITMIYALFYFNSFYSRIKNEMFLTRKHLYIWHNIIISKIENAIITENDLTLEGNKNGSLEILKDTMTSGKLIIFSHSIKLPDLMVDKLLTIDQGNTLRFQQILSNGSSGYAISLDLAKQLNEVVTKMPSLALLPIDYLLVAVGLKITQNFNRSTETIFIYPSDFVHLSSGKLASTLR
jgi:hypothetical protein